MTPEIFNSKDYQDYKQDCFSSRLLKREDWLHFLELLKPDSKLFSKQTIGLSTEGVEIDCWRWGKGDTKILLWSQMHGNEPTGTMAFADIFSFLNTKEYKYTELRAELHNNLSLYFIPILNPDGAKRFKRANALEVDINRDAVAQNTTEMQAFMGLKSRIKPDYAFNIHDQRNIFSAGKEAKPATISFLAPSSDYSRQITPARDKAMEIIAGMYETIKEEIEGFVGRYSDEYYPRALGDYFQSEGVPCILIESGAAFDDPMRNTARKMNFLGLISAFRQIAGGIIVNKYRDQYLSIPENHELYCDLIFRNATFGKDENAISMDLGIMLQEKLSADGDSLTKTYLIKEVGDLSFNHTLKEYTDVELVYETLPKPDYPADLKVLQNGESIMEFKDGILSTHGREEV